MTHTALCSGNLLSHLKGVADFRSSVLPEARALFRELAEGDSSHPFVITCADSQVVRKMITQAKSGEMFVFRNVGNIAVDCGEMAGEVSAAIDYAMAALHACYLVICGHSDQGAQKCRLNPGGTCELETVNVWLGNAHARCNAVLARNLPDAKTSRVVTGDSLCPQLTHLRTYPSVAVALARISITLDGVGIYDVGDDKVEGREKVKIQYISICERIKDECAV